MKRSAGYGPPRMGESFSDVLLAAQAGAPWALDRLYRHLAPAVAGYLRVQGSADADDLTSDVFFKAFSRIAGFSGTEDRFRSWVFTIAHNLLIDERRRRNRRPAMVSAEEAPEPEAPGGDAADEALRRMSCERVRRLCEGLAPDQRDVLTLRIIAGMTLEQTAEALGKSTGAVKALQHRALVNLRRQITKQGVSL